MAKQKFGISFDVLPVSDLQFMRELCFDPKDGSGSYTHRDKMLMIELKAAMRGDRKALIWLIKHLSWESKARMTVPKENQTIQLRENPYFVSPAAALEVLGIGWLERLHIGLREWLAPLSDDPDSQRFQANFPYEVDQWRQIEYPVFGHLETWFLDGALARKDCPSDAGRHIRNWRDRACIQPLAQQRWPLRPDPLIKLDRPRRSREDCWFKAGQSGNPKGKSEGTRNKSNRGRTEFFDELINVTIGGKKRRLKRREFFFRRVEAKAIAEQDHEIIRLLLDKHIVMSRVQATVPYHKAEPWVRSVGGIRPDSLEGVIHSLGGGDLLYANSPTARMLLEPWLIEMGLDHLGDRRLSYDQQRLVLFFSRHPNRTNWPAWWEAELRSRGGLKSTAR